MFRILVFWFSFDLLCQPIPNLPMVLVHVPEWASSARWVGITIAPVVFLMYDYKCGTIEHERRHIEQVSALGWVPFYYDYLVQFGYNYYMTRDSNFSYNAITFEIEARTYEFC